MGRNGTGVTESRGKVRLNFTFEVRRCRETLPLDWTPVNIKAAGRMLAKIKRDIENGLFDYRETFPDSLSKAVPKFSAAAGAGGSTIGRALDDWLETKGQKSGNTRKQYKNAAEVWKKLLGGADRPLKEVTPTVMAKVVGGTAWSSPKLLNNYLIVIRGALALAAREHKDYSDPMNGIENSRVQNKAPDPLSKIEMEQVLKDMHKHYPATTHAYFVFAFATGMRPEELIALKWSDVDWNGKTIHVCRAKTLGVVGPVKTYEIRDVDLIPVAVAALETMKRITATQDTIFINATTKKAWNDNKSQHEHHWVPTLKRCGIRARRCYNTRHTFATVRLMLGIIPAYISRQMGHNSAKMLFEKYARWIDGADRDRERNKVEAALAAL
jgi:integrase